MAIRSRDILKDWFKRGKYPLENQFADWIDSFVHLGEDSIPISGVDGLANQLNEKFDRNTGQALAGKFAVLQSKVDNYIGLTDQLKNVADHFRVEEADDESDFDIDSYIQPGYYFLVVMKEGHIAWHRILIVEECDYYDRISSSNSKQYLQTMFSPYGLLTRKGYYSHEENGNGDDIDSLTWNQWINLSDGVIEHEKQLNGLASQLATADTKLSNIFSTIGRLKILTFANPEEFAARDAELIPEAGIFRIDYTDTTVDCTKGESTDTPTTSRESEYIICVSGNKIALTERDTVTGGFHRTDAYEQVFLQVRLSLDDISYRKVFYRYNPYHTDTPVGEPMGSPYIYQPTDWISLRGSKLSSDFTWLDPVRNLHSTDLLPLQPGTDEKAGSATLDQLKTFVTADLSDFKNYAPIDNITDLRPGVYVHRGLAPGGSFETEIISYEDSGRQTVQGGGYLERWTRTYYCVRLSSSGLEYRTGTATMTIPMPEPAEIEWDDWTSLEKALSSKADVEDLSNVYGEPTSVDSNDKFEALTGFTREDMKKDLFIDLWEHLTWGYWHDLSQPEQCGGYNKATDLFWLYDIHDISYEEALEIAAIGAPIINGTSFSISVFAHMRRPHRFRTHLPIKSSASNLQFTGDHTFWNCPIEQIVLPSVNARNYFLHNCTVEKLRCYTLASGIASTSCRNLREIVLMCPDNSMARGNFSFIGSPGLTQPSVKMIVDKMKPDSISPVAITVHPDVFAKLTDEANAEWHQVLTDAIEKNIQFATV